MVTQTPDEYTFHDLSGRIGQITIVDDVVRVDERGLAFQRSRSLPIQELCPRYSTMKTRRPLFGITWCLAIFMVLSVVAPVFKALTAVPVIWKTVIPGFCVFAIGCALMWRLIFHSTVEWIVFPSNREEEQIAFTRAGPDAFRADEFIKRLTERIQSAQDSTI